MSVSNTGCSFSRPILNRFIIANVIKCTLIHLVPLANWFPYDVTAVNEV